jgi:hypothetical protein
MLAPLRCPTCSAPLEIPGEYATTTRCTYCGAGVLLTERGGRVQAAAPQARHADAIGAVLRHLRAGDRSGAVRAYREHFGVGMAEAAYAVERIEAGQGGGAAPADSASVPFAAAPPSGRPRAAVGVAVLLVAVSAGIGVVAMTSTVETTASAPGVAAPLRAEDGSGAFAREVLRFGSQGNGAGRFEDPRSVAVDGAGRLYVPDYASARVQVFDSAGTFLTQWILDPDLSLSDIEVDRQGTVYLVQDGRIRRVEGTTGRLLGELPRPGMFGYHDVALALDGTLWATDMHHVFHLGRNGQVLREIAVTEVVPRGGSPARVAVSGDGHLYVTSLMGREVYHLDPDGRFIDRFGPAAEPGRPTPTIQEMAFDGRGRLFVSMLGRGIRVYGPGGTEVGGIESDDAVFGLAFNDRDELYAVLRNDHQVVKYRLNH